MTATARFHGSTSKIAHKTSLSVIMTQKFLDIFFKGKWYLYGHFTVVSLIGFISQPYWELIEIGLLSYILGGITGFVLMLIKEIMDGLSKNNFFSWDDITWNGYGMFFVFINGLLIEFIL